MAGNKEVIPIARTTLAAGRLAGLISKTAGLTQVLAGRELDVALIIVYTKAITVKYYER